MCGLKLDTNSQNPEPPSLWIDVCYNLWIDVHLVRIRDRKLHATLGSILDSLVSYLGGHGDIHDHVMSMQIFSLPINMTVI